MQTTDKDIQVLEEMLSNLSYVMSNEDTPFQAGIKDRHTALSNILSDFRDMREMLEAASNIGFFDYPSILRFRRGEGWVTDSRYIPIDSALDAWREVKEKR